MWDYILGTNIIIGRYGGIGGGIGYLLADICHMDEEEGGICHQGGIETITKVNSNMLFFAGRNGGMLNSDLQAAHEPLEAGMNSVPTY